VHSWRSISEVGEFNDVAAHLGLATQYLCLSPTLARLRQEVALSTNGYEYVVQCRNVRHGARRRLNDRSRNKKSPRRHPHQQCRLLQQRSSTSKCSRVSPPRLLRPRLDPKLQASNLDKLLHFLEQDFRKEALQAALKDGQKSRNGRIRRNGRRNERLLLVSIIQITAANI
jgi:hypothetical protein